MSVPCDKVGRLPHDATRKAGDLSAERPGEADELADAEELALRLMRLGPQSRMALKMALLAFSTEGGSGELTIKIPKNPKNWPDLRFETDRV